MLMALMRRSSRDLVQIRARTPAQSLQYDSEMRWVEVRTNWRALRAQMLAKWSKLSHDDIETIEGRRPKLIALLQQRYALDEAQATDQADAFVRSLQVLSL